MVPITWDVTPRIPATIDIVIEKLNMVLRGLVNYFRIGHASKWFKKVRRYIRRVRNKAGYGWKGISKEYLYKDLVLYNNYRVSWRSEATKLIDILANLLTEIDMFDTITVNEERILGSISYIIDISV